MMLAPYSFFLGPAWFRRFLAKLVPENSFRELKSMVDTMDTTSREILATKKRAFLRGDETVKSQVGGGKDIMSILST